MGRRQGDGRSLLKPWVPSPFSGVRLRRAADDQHPPTPGPLSAGGAGEVEIIVVEPRHHREFWDVRDYEDSTRNVHDAIRPQSAQDPIDV